MHGWAMEKSTGKGNIFFQKLMDKFSDNKKSKLLFKENLKKLDEYILASKVCENNLLNLLCSINAV